MLYRIISAFFAVISLAVLSVGQNHTTGSIKGKLRVESGHTAAGVKVIAEQDGREVMHVETDRKGEFTMTGLAPGLYKLTFRKPGLSVGTMQDVKVRAREVRKLDRLFLPVDEGSIVFIKGSIFTAEGRSAPGVQVEIARLEGDGTAKKLDSRISTETGSFTFRLKPETARYRVTAKVDGMEPVVKDIEVEGAAVYRIALSLPLKASQ